MFVMSKDSAEPYFFVGFYDHTKVLYSKYNSSKRDEISSRLTMLL